MYGGWVRTPAKCSCQVKSESIDVVLFNPVFEAVHNLPQRCWSVGADRVATAWIVEQLYILLVIHHVVGLSVDESVRDAVRINVRSLYGMIVNNIKDDLNSASMQPASIRRATFFIDASASCSSEFERQSIYIFKCSFHVDRNTARQSWAALLCTLGVSMSELTWQSTFSIPELASLVVPGMASIEDTAILINKPQWRWQTYREV